MTLTINPVVCVVLILAVLAAFVIEEKPWRW